MKTLLGIMRYSYGDPALGLSYEYHNLYLPLKQAANVILFDFLEVAQREGKAAMNQKLLEIVRSERPRVVIIAPYTDEFTPETLDELKQLSVTVGYFADDTWRWEYSRFWAGHFSYVTTSDVNGVRRFRDAGYDDAIYSPFACDPAVYPCLDLPKLYDVTFVGQYHPQRDWYCHQLRRAGIDVKVWGKGWPVGVLDQEAMVRIFNQSRINLNLSNCVLWDARYLLWSLSSIRSLRTFKINWRALRRADAKTREMVKGRHFEISACGGFQLSYYVDGLEQLYQIGSEIAVYSSPEELIEKTIYYLRHADEREAMAQRGYERTLKDHTMERRLAHLFDAMGITDWRTR